MERLTRRADFRAAAGGLRASAGAFVVQARRRTATGPVRVGFTVSRQVGNAVERNRVRRRLREIVRLAADGAGGERGGGGGMQSGHDYVLIGRRAALTAPFAEMRRDFDAALNRIHDIARTGRSDRAADDGVPRGTGAAPPGSLHQPGSRQRQPSPPTAPRRSGKPRNA